MAYPARSTFRSAAPGSLWWRLTAGMNTWICSSSGFEFIVELGQVLHEMNIPVQASYDGTRVGSSSITHFTGEYGPTTNRLLWLALKTFPEVPVAVLNVVKAAGNSHTITASTIAAAAFVLTKAHFTQAAGLTLGNVLVPGDVIAPVWNTAPPVVSNPMLTVCAMTTSDADSTPVVPPPSVPGAAPVLQAVAPSMPFTPIGSTTPDAPITAGPIDTTIPPAAPAADAPTQQGLGWGAIATGVVVTTGLVALGVSLRNSHKSVKISPPAKKGRKNPSSDKQIVLAWVTTRLHGLPGVTSPRAVAAMWVNQGGAREIAAAKAYAQKELTKGGDSYPRVFVYEGEDQPLQRARRELTISRGL